jgi:Protein of unknown function (DUF2924)
MSRAADALPDLSKLPDLSANELDTLWRAHLGGTMPKQLPKFLQSRMLAYSLQVQQSGGLSKATSRFLDQIAIDLEAGREPSLRYPAEHRLKPGIIIMREHNGVHQRVMVLDEGFAWNGRSFGSLSAVAKAITGTNWNGQRFFGLWTCHGLIPRP